MLFIALWSSDLSSAFDDYFTSAATCTAWTPNGRYYVTPESLGLSDRDGGVPDDLCTKQAVLISMVFVSVILYQAVLVVSLFRSVYLVLSATGD